MLGSCVRRSVAFVVLVVASSLVVASCTRRQGQPTFPDAQLPDTGIVIDAGTDAGPDSGHDAALPDAALDPDAACTSATSTATLERLPVDIIWVVDNSNSEGMVAAIDSLREGVSDFAERLVGSGLDYRMILLSLRTARTGRHPICVPEPLAGPDCADSERFFQLDIDIRSTQLVEQTLANLPAVIALLRPGASRTIVMVTDDNQRTCARPVGTCAAGDPPLTVTSLEDFPGGANPFNSTTLSAGILQPIWSGMFDGYTFNAMYGWGSETDDEATCTFTDGSEPPNSGTTYTALVRRTGGVRARICDGPDAWVPFFEQIASGVEESSPIACEIAIPPPPTGMTLNPSRVNVVVRVGDTNDYVGRVPDVDHCDSTRGGWYYDDATAPTEILLCPTSCTDAQDRVVGPETGLDVQFGCDSILI